MGGRLLQGNDVIACQDYCGGYYYAISILAVNSKLNSANLEWIGQR